MGLIIEFNNVFLHARRLLLWSGFTKDSRIYQINKYANIGSFFILRVSILGYSLCVSIMQTRSDGSSSFLKIYPGWIVCSLYLVIQVVNAILFYRLITSDFLTKNKTLASVADQTLETEAFKTKTLDTETLKIESH